MNGQSVWVIKGGYSNGGWGGCNLTDMSYYTPAFFRVFAEVSGDAAWSKLADDTYIILNAAAHPSTGLVPDWQTAAGVPGPSGWNGTYSYDASRVPWRIALDYLWNGNQQAKDWCTKVSNWANGIGPANIKDGYNLDGTTTKTNNNSAFVGGFAVAAMCNSQAVADNFGTRMSQLNDSYWYNLNLRVVYLHVMTGNFWKPTNLTTAIPKEVIDNPVKVHFEQDGKFFISGMSGVKSIEFVNMSGNVIKSFTDINSEEFSGQIPYMKQGVYILRVRYPDGKQNNLKIKF